MNIRFEGVNQNAVNLTSMPSVKGDSVKLCILHDFKFPLIYLYYPL